MDQSSWLVAYGILFVEALLLSALFTPVTIRLARRWGCLAMPGERHVHKEATPTLGGLAIVGSVLLVVIGNAALGWLLEPAITRRLPEIGQYLVNIPSTARQLGSILGGALLMSILGLVDDRHPLGPKLKLFFMILVAGVLLIGGVRVRLFLPWPWLGATVTVAWIVFLTNSFNFLDNMDGLCAGVAAIVCFAFAGVSFLAGEWFITAVHIVLAGALLGFLWHNFHPARLFMGDNGSLFVGYVIGALSILTTYYKHDVPTRLPVLTPLIILGVPIFDTVSVLWIRWRSGRPLMQGDKNHFSHRLTDLGMSTRRAVTFIYVVTGAVALAAVPLRSLNMVGGLAILAQVSLLLWAFHRLERTARKRTEGDSDAGPNSSGES